MLARALSSPPRHIVRVYDFDDVPIAIDSSSADVMSAIDHMMHQRSHAHHELDRAFTIGADLLDDSWHVTVDGTMVRGLPKSLAAPIVAEEIIATACATAARERKSILIQGAILERDGRGLALIGGDLDAAKALSLHLHARRWTAISFGYSFLNPKTLDIVGLQSLAAISSRSLDQIPRRYRRAIEASKWYDSGRHLTFYAVDPYLVHPDHALSSTLTHVLLIDGRVEETPSIDDAFEVADIGFLENHPMAGSMKVAKMTLGTPISSTDAIEHWFSD